MSGSNPPTVVIDDLFVHYNTSREASQALKPSDAVAHAVKTAQISPWNNSLAVITSPVSIWYNVTGYTRIAVYGSIIQPSDLGLTAWANYTIDGKYTAGNITTCAFIVTDFPLFTSVQLDPNQRYNLTADIWASPDAPYLFDYLLAFSPPDPTPISTSSTASSTNSNSASATVTLTTESSSSKDSTSIPHLIAVIGGIAGACALLLALLLVGLFCWCRGRGSKPKKIDTEEPVGPKSRFAPTASGDQSATLVFTNASGHAESVLDPSLRASSSMLAPTSRLSLVPEDSPALAGNPPPAPRQATSCPGPTVSGTPWGMSAPTTLHLPTSGFEHPPAGPVLTHTPQSTTTALGPPITGGPSALAAPTTTRAAPASSSLRKPRRGPDEYPPERNEARPEPPVQRLASASSPEREEFEDCPPAYSS